MRNYFTSVNVVQKKGDLVIRSHTAKFNPVAKLMMFISHDKKYGFAITEFNFDDNTLGIVALPQDGSDFDNTACTVSIVPGEWAKYSFKDFSIEINFDEKLFLKRSFELTYHSKE